MSRDQKRERELERGPPVTDRTVLYINGGWRIADLSISLPGMRPTDSLEDGRFCICLYIPVFLYLMPSCSMSFGPVVLSIGEYLTRFL